MDRKVFASFILILLAVASLWVLAVLFIGELFELTDGLLVIICLQCCFIMALLIRKR